MNQDTSEKKQMNDKKLIFLTCVGLIVICSVIFLLLLLSGGNNEQTPPISSPIETPDNIIDIEAEVKKDFMFAVITDEGTIETRNNLNDRVIISLDKKNWKNIKWSPDNKYISVLGETSPNVFDIYLYSLDSKEWKRYTTYTPLGTGVTSYEWVTSQYIYFIQGNKPDRWIHRLGIPSQEILKLNRVGGDLTKVSNNFNYLLEKVSNGFRILDLNGNTVYSLNTMEELLEDDAVRTFKVTDLFFTDNPDKLIIQSNNSYYKAEFGSLRAIKLDNIKFDVVCTEGEDEVLGFLQTKNELDAILADTKEDEISDLVGRTFDSEFEVLSDRAICHIGKNILLKVKADEANKWFTVEQDELIEASFLSGADVISVKNLNL